MRRKFKELEDRALARPERIARFCNNPACDLCDVHVKPREVLRKRDQEVCPRCLEPLVVRPIRPRLPTLPFKPRIAPRSPRTRAVGGPR